MKSAQLYSSIDRHTDSSSSTERESGVKDVVMSPPHLVDGPDLAIPVKLLRQKRLGELKPNNNNNSKQPTTSTSKAPPQDSDEKQIIPVCREKRRRRLG